MCYINFSICKENDIPFEIVTLAYKEKSEVMRWMIDGQLGRRNLTPIQRVAVAEKYREKFEKIAKDRQGTRTDLNLVTNLSQGNDSETESNRTRTELAKLADVSEGTYDKAKKILDSNNEEVKQKVLSGEIKIDKGYKEIFKPKVETKVETKVEEEKITPKITVQKDIPPISPNRKICTQCGVEKPNIDFYGNDLICKECVRSNSEKEPFEVQGGGAFIDFATGKPRIAIEKGIDADILAEVKTSKNAYDYIIVESELAWLEETGSDFIEGVDGHFFTMIKAIGKFNDEEIDQAVEVLEETKEEINLIINKFNENKKPEPIKYPAKNESNSQADIDTSTEIGRIILELKTPKIITDLLVPNDEFEMMKESLLEAIATRVRFAFEVYNLPSKMTLEDKEYAIKCIEEVEIEARKFKEQIQNIEI